MSPRAFGPQILCTFSILCCCMISVLGNRSYDYGHDVLAQLKEKRASSDGIVITTGMPRRSNGSVPVRSEIRTLQQDADKWTLYLLALDMMQYTNQTVDTSWFSISSIHGVPFESWNGVESTSGNENSGYCQHETVLFPTWHRAYVALYEQEVCRLEQLIATMYPENQRSQMEAAASDCRVPYFDWAATPPSGQGILPLSIGGSPTINVTGPSGAQLISNPLYTYDFKPPNPSVFYGIAPWADWNSTMRSPTSVDADARSNNTKVNQALLSNMASNQQRIYNLFSSYTNYTIFSNEGWAADTSQYDSLESLHDNIHAMLGGSDGHMTIVPFSAFDPLFFLHHCMVDRLLALWQGLNPNSWVQPNQARVSSYTTSVGEWLDSSSALTPFYASSNGTFWNSDMLRDWTTLGYTYPELGSISLSNSTTVSAGRADLVAAITKLYGSYSSNRLVAGSSSKRHDVTSRFRSNARHEIGSRASTLPLAKIITNGTQYREWIANVRVERQGLNGSGSISLSLSDGTHIGTMGIFASPPSIASFMQMAPRAGLIASVIPLTNTLIDELANDNITSLDPPVVGPFLTDHLLVTVTQGNRGNGTQVDPHSVPGLNITIMSSLVEGTSSDAHLPTWGEPDYMLEYLS